MKSAKVVLGACRLRPRKLLFMIGSVCLIVGLADFGYATPPIADCSTSTDVYERLKCRENGLYKQMEELNLHIQNDDVFSETVKGKKKEASADIKNRAKKANERSKKDHFKKQIKKARKAGNDTCYFIEFDNGLGNGDGVCDLETEDCAAEIDQTKKCEPNLKKDKPNQGQYVCAEKCEGAVAPSTEAEEAQEEIMAEELEKTYLIFEEQAQEMNENIENIDTQPQPVSTMTLLNENGDDGADGNGDDGTECDLNPSTALISLEHSKYTSQVAFAVARGAEDVLLTVCGTSVLGNNTSFLCTIPEGLVALFAIANEGIDVAYNILKEGQNDKVTNCLIGKLNGIPTGGELEEGFAASQAAIKADTESIVSMHNTNIENKIKDSETTLSAQIENLKIVMDKHALEIKTLLNTPQGQRPSFPKK